MPLIEEEEIGQRARCCVVGRGMMLSSLPIMYIPQIMCLMLLSRSIAVYLLLLLLGYYDYLFAAGTLWHFGCLILQSLLTDKK